MRRHHTKNKGDLGVFKAQLSLCEQGYTVLLPLTEHEEFDLVAYKDGKFHRIQVKYRESVEGKIKVGASTSWADKHGNHRSLYSNIDVVCIYCPTTDVCYYVPFKGESSFSLCLVPPKNNQVLKIKMADDYTVL